MKKLLLKNSKPNFTPTYFPKIIPEKYFYSEAYFIINFSNHCYHFKTNTSLKNGVTTHFQKHYSLNLRKLQNFGKLLHFFYK